VLQDECRFVQLLRRRVSANGNGSDLLERTPDFAQAKLDGLRWKAGPMLDAPKAFLFGRRNQNAVHENCCRRIGMVGIQSKYDLLHFFSFFISMTLNRCTGCA